MNNHEIPLRTPPKKKKIKALLRKLRTISETKCEVINRREYGNSTHWFKRSSKGRIEVSGKGFFTRQPPWQNFNIR